MTNEPPSPEGAQDEAPALQVADLLLRRQAQRADALEAAAAMLIQRLHARVQELERAVAHAEMAADTEGRYADERCAKAAADERNACEQACERIAALKWDAYKGYNAGHPNDPDRGSPHAEGMADGAGLCAQAIRARGAQGESNAT